MEIIKRYLTKNRCYTNPVKIKIEKLVLHSLGVAQPNANVLIRSWDSADAGVSIHAFVMDHQIVQTLPWDIKAWHVGSGKNGSYNNCSIGVEICEPSGHKYNGGTMVGYDVDKNAEYFKAVYNNAVELFAFLCKQYDLDPLKDILCHCEVFKLGYGSNHADVMQWFPKHGKSMDTFRADVKAMLSTEYIPSKSITPKSDPKDIIWAQAKLNKVLAQVSGFTSLKIDGIYGPKMRIAVLMYWDLLGWGKDMADDGKMIGKATIAALAAERTE
jgi:N-acetylmuramoyl-L-alanine amidase CwlA